MFNPISMKRYKGHPIILFDGVCNLCNSSVQFIIRNDPKGIFRFASLQSDFGQTFLKNQNRPLDSFDTLILIDGQIISFESTAALKIARKLKGLWPLFYGFMLIPKPIRDYFYKLISKNRYSLFGKREECMIPDGELLDLFVDHGMKDH